MDDEEVTRDAHRLRELFKGRFDQDTAVRLITDTGGIMQALDFVFNVDEAQVSAFLKQSPGYLQSLKADSEKVATILNNKIENSVRQFVCGDCHRSWWKRVPMRKEVSKCRRCFVKYDPIPREHESGLGMFLCPCGNEFTGFACMGETLSKCYKCGKQVPVDHMMPPRKNRNPKTAAPHSCNGVNCYNLGHNHQRGEPGNTFRGNTNPYPDVDDDSYLFGQAEPYVTPTAKIWGGRGARRQNRRDKDNRSQVSDTADDGVPMCAHPKSGTRTIRHVSKKHISTGSTVSTFLSQASLETQSISVVSSLYTIREKRE